MVCSAVCLSGEMAQQLKTGYLIGATPKRQTTAQILGLAIACLALVPVLTVLSQTYGIGTGAPGSLKAPQATLFASLAEGFFGAGSLPWNKVGLGVLVGIFVLILDRIQEKRGGFRLPLMAVAVGMYLPVTLAVPLFLGGLVHHWSRDTSNTGAGVLFASGLIAGESLMGVGLGAILYFFPTALPIPLVESNGLSTAVLGVLVFILWRVSRKSSRAKMR
jgi:putative OPT family oligopeptide transporter